MESAPAPETTIDGRTYLYFGGTGYLGLAAHPDVIEAGCEAMRRYGVHSATTRARIGTNPPVRDVEQLAAEFFGTEAAFYFGSGYFANHLILAAQAGNHDAILIDEGAHYCLLEAARASGLPAVPFAHRDPDRLAEAAGEWERILVMADAICPSTGVSAPILDYLEVMGARDRQRVDFLFDDAHGFGVLGPNGRGLLDDLDLWSGVNRNTDDEGVRFFVCGTLAKALGGFGGIIPGSGGFVERTRTSSHLFNGASAPASAIAGASAQALKIIMQDPSLREALHRNIAHLHSALRALGLKIPETNTAHLGVSIGDAANMQRLHHTLKERGILVPYVGEYTGLPDGGVLRIAVFATHSADQIDTLISELSSIL